MLAWSFNREGEAQPGLVEARDRDMDMSTSERSAARQDLLPLAHPQEGVDALERQIPTADPGDTRRRGQTGGEIDTSSKPGSIAKPS